jgi:exopolyphosphatase/guanosine-5'-triphosphate,3'-diphosphate pyrophosphatase
MKIAAIDLGSNSIHMVIAEVGQSGSFHILDSEKDMVRLGAATLARGRLPAAAIRRGLEVLRDYKRLAGTHRVDKIIAVATSAIREARNGEDFLDRIGDEIRIYPRAISGEEEARLVYLAALHSVHLEGRRALVIDVGGGSVELALGTAGAIDLVASEKLGVLRLAESHVGSDPISAKDEKRLVSHIEEVLAPHVERIRTKGFDVAVGVSGTILALGSLALEMSTGRRPESLHHVTVPYESLHSLRKRLCASDMRSRLRMGSLDQSRADIIVPGAILVDTLLSRLGVKELTLSTWALREGILLNYISRHPRTLARAEAYPDVRRRSVVELAERCLYDESHASHVSALALSVFEGTRKLHRLDDHARSLLAHSAVLHDVGHHISHLRHHRHSEYLIRNGDLRGFDPSEIEVMATVARYHRQGKPKKKHEPFATMPAAARRTVRVLAGILRIADSLDRSHRQLVKRVSVERRAGVITLVCEVAGNIELELWGARRRVDLLQEVLDVRIRYRTIAARPSAAPSAAALTGADTGTAHATESAASLSSTAAKAGGAGSSTAGGTAANVRSFPDRSSR